MPADHSPTGGPIQLDVQFNPATIPWLRLRDGAALAERAGFGAIWVYDHLAGASVHGDTMLEAFSLLGALAAVTERVALGTLVLNVGHRRPAITAVGAASVSSISGRPVFLGLGAGASPSSPWAEELHHVGQAVEPSLALRHDAVAIVIETCRRLWAMDRSPGLATVPRPHVDSQIHIGANGPGLARLAGRCADAMNLAWNHPRRDELIGVARAAAIEAGRVGIDITTYHPWDPALLDESDARRREMQTVGVRRLVLLVRDPSVLVDLNLVS